jgi:hypothetical protein
MTVGFSNDQIMADFLKNIEIVVKETQADLEAMAAGENPSAATFTKALFEKFPNFPVAEVTIAGILLMSLLKTIVSNNEALGKIIPHLDA